MNLKFTQISAEKSEAYLFVVSKASCLYQSETRYHGKHTSVGCFLLGSPRCNNVFLLRLSTFAEASQHT